MATESPTTPAQEPSVEEMAALDWEPYSAKAIKAIETALDAEFARHDHVVAARIATAIVSKTRQELIQSARELWGDPEGEGPDFVRLVRSLGDSAEGFRQLAKMIDSAESRLMCALAAVDLGEGDAGHA